MTKAIAAFRVLLGIYYLANGLNFYFHFYPLPPSQNPVANMLMGGFVSSGMFDIVKIMEVLGGLALMFNLFAPLTMVLLFPLAVIIGYIDVFVLGSELNGTINGGLFFISNTILLLLYLPYYRPMFVRHGVPDPSFSTLRPSNWNETPEAPQIAGGR